MRGRSTTFPASWPASDVIWSTLDAGTRMCVPAASRCTPMDGMSAAGADSDRPLESQDEPIE